MQERVVREHLRLHHLHLFYWCHVAAAPHHSVALHRYENIKLKQQLIAEKTYRGPGEHYLKYLPPAFLLP